MIVEAWFRSTAPVFPEVVLSERRGDRAFLVTRECLAASPVTSISGRRAACELTVRIERRGKPGMIVADNGTQFTSNALLVWAQDNQLVRHFHFIASFARQGLPATREKGDADAE